ncbi:universal stress protein [Mycolicibacterium litorale]|uniref:Universal stress protein n=1 Tax=Mycolicibacterium litorale TaxID=758802 RepID=A0AAD1IRJ9_9MYCO|nr:universal stress protein [Mycolicibacterium litorale]MCV7417019.1 universal stress protein [Mycolicibacterium litorale]TDY04805.1 nucleotide-binding universal stress UspA family protein [Mycolicibacterium litorale]BBY18232.1 universal stress protein [Mycolicibacterium litorale]
MPENTVVVGIDGSDSALQAARWAGAVAAACGSSLHIVHAMPSIGRNLTETAAAIQAAIMTYQRDSALIFLRAASDAVRKDRPELAVTTEASETPVDEALIDASGAARLIVLGGKDVTGAAAVLLGSTTLRVATHAVCPVVAFRGDKVAVSDKPIVVGVDGTGAGAGVLATAFDFAKALNVGLVAVRSWTTRAPAGDVTIPFLIDWDALETAEWSALTGLVDEWRQRYPEVKVECAVETMSPGRALLSHAADAQLVVVGSRGRNALAGLVLGSTSMNLLHHSPIPVMVTRAQAD